jgi:cytochrome c oxidase cbb3-type subunit I/II
LEWIYGFWYDLLVDSKNDKGPLFSLKLANFTLDWNLRIILYTIPMYVAGFLQASMWKQFNPDGTLTYGNFLGNSNANYANVLMRAIGGTLYIIGMFVLTYNVIRTVRANAKVEDELAEAPELQKLAVVELKERSSTPWLEKTNSVDHIGY